MIIIPPPSAVRKKIKNGVCYCGMLLKHKFQLNIYHSNKLFGYEVETDFDQLNPPSPPTKFRDFLKAYYLQKEYYKLKKEIGKK